MASEPLPSRRLYPTRDDGTPNGPEASGAAAPPVAAGVRRSLFSRASDPRRQAVTAAARAAQGLPETVEDSLTLREIGRILG